MIYEARFWVYRLQSNWKYLNCHRVAFLSVVAYVEVQEESPGTHIADHQYGPTLAPPFGSCR